MLVWLGDLRTPALTSLMRGISATVSPVPVQIAWLVALAVLVGTRRWRHLFVSILALGLTNTVVTNVAGAVRRPRPLGVEILGPWTDFSMPSLPIAILAALALTHLYALIPQGRWRQVGKWVATGLVAVLALARMYLAQDYPSDVVVGVILGVTIPLVAFG